MMYNENRTNAYRFTIGMKDGAPSSEVDRAQVTALRVTVSALNILDGRKRYVKLQGRGPRKVNGKKYFQSLPLKYATSADVYIYERYNG